MASLPDWALNQRLDILVLGPMGPDKNPAGTLRPIKRAVEAILRSPEFKQILSRNKIRKTNVHVPDDNRSLDIVHDVLRHLESADLVIFNLTPKTGRTEASANVFYELGLVNSLGIPAIMIMAKGGTAVIPFYARSSLVHRVVDFEQPTLTKALRGVLRDFLVPKSSKTNFADNRVTQFYGLPVVDISAAVGLATGYYYNFIGRLLTEGGFIAAYPQLIRQVIVVRPTAIDSTYPSDIAVLKAVLEKAGFTLSTEKLTPPANDPLGQLWFDHVDGIVIDIPRTVYPLQRSPRLLTFLKRRPIGAKGAVLKEFNQRKNQIGHSLLTRFEHAIDYQMQVDGSRVRSKVLHYSTFKSVPRLVARLLKS